MHFEREKGYYINTVFFPTIVVVCVSWTSFWLQPSATPARMSLGALVVLTLITHFAANRNQLPKITYSTGFDYWELICLGYAVTSCMEFAVVNWLYRYQAVQDKKDQRKLKVGRCR